MEKQSNFKTIYSNLIAGRLPVGSASPRRVVENHAYALLGTSRLHTYFEERAGYVYYFAIESRFLASAPGFNLPFVDVLPGGPLYQGDAIYLLNGGDFSVAMVLESGSLRLLCNDVEAIKDYLIDLDLQIVEIDNRGGKSLNSVPQAIRGISDRVSSWLMKGSLGVLMVSLMGFVGIQVGTTVLSRSDDTALNAQAVENDLNATLKDLSVQQPLARQISRIQIVSATVVRSGGWIQSYRLEGENNESFEIVLPSWVSQDYLDSLGRNGVTTDLRDIEGLLTVRKLDKKGKKS
ncbi:MAG: hypothetical protein KJ798_11945 [Gammaproteobacteria bacterium]|uniref:hypothetical protein n=1 Tax=Limnobacter sp. TaxID=2003368 RepID=UPI001DE6EC4D|nr:hypothetical protein [Limnobacter sp.]MBU0784835.1 hypothetical protein [Gammaproteobacteria bacterium]MBU0850411.1 hypothetical protein [Gammaproteobacteria bacterium]MBU1528498.1 hypothetical protein [Gammaproteobacteria bacterium]MBU1781080.1 hypothetical protein [Gammaproteobacteria bacterium]MBU2128318.1 hypothetical protein [Gammaproteobacteria bacterium]